MHQQGAFEVFRDFITSRTHGERSTVVLIACWAVWVREGALEITEFHFVFGIMFLQRVLIARRKAPHFVWNTEQQSLSRSAYFKLDIHRSNSYSLQIQIVLWRTEGFTTVSRQ